MVRRAQCFRCQRDIDHHEQIYRVALRYYCGRCADRIYEDAANGRLPLDT